MYGQIGGLLAAFWISIPKDLVLELTGKHFSCSKQFPGKLLIFGLGSTAHYTLHLHMNIHLYLHLYISY